LRNAVVAYLETYFYHNTVQKRPLYNSYFNSVPVLCCCCNYYYYYYYYCCCCWL